MPPLTKEKLSSIKPGTIFATGLLVNSKGLVNRWVAKKGRVNDWAIYYGDMGCPIQIAEHGNKISSKDEIPRIIPCNIDVLKAYRR